MEESTVEAEVLWAPTPEMVERSQLTHYIRWLAENRDLHFEDYHALWRWSVTEIEEFWGTLWEYFGVIASRDPQGAPGSEAEEAPIDEVREGGPTRGAPVLRAPVPFPFPAVYP